VHIAWAVIVFWKPYSGRLTAVGNRCADHVTPIYPQKLALTSPTGGGRSVGIVRSRTKATEFFIVGEVRKIQICKLHHPSGSPGLSER
jgi:hypothetical protein